MTTPKTIPADRVDWFRVLSDLRRAGMALTLIATVTHSSKTRLLGLRNADAEPKHATGERIIRLWIQQTGLPREKLPMQSATYSSERADVRRWEGGTRHCPMCGREHGPMGDKSSKGARKGTRAEVKTQPLFGLDSAPH